MRVPFRYLEKKLSTSLMNSNGPLSICVVARVRIEKKRGVFLSASQGVYGTSDEKQAKDYHDEWPDEIEISLD